MLDDRLPGGHDDETQQPKAETGQEKPASDGSLSDDIAALIDDGRTYVEAEIAFQRTRLAVTADHGKSGLILGICAFAVLHLALVALVVGAIFALTPHLTALGATAMVVGMLLAAGLILGVKAKNRFSRLIEAYQKAKE